jgi:hypothetical protein
MVADFELFLTAMRFVQSNRVEPLPLAEVDTGASRAGL